MAVPNSPTCKLWATLIVIASPNDFQVPNWNNGAGVPDLRARLQAQGGVDYSGAVIPGPPNTLCPKLYLTGQGVQGSVIYNFGPDFKGEPPEGFFPGWPTEDFAGFSSMDPATKQGSATPTGNFVDYPSTFGMIQSKDGHRHGNFYFEFTHNFNTFFAGNLGAGVARFMPDLNFWSNAQFGAGDDNAGVKVANGNLGSGFAEGVQANGGAVLPLGVNGTNGTTFGVAVTILPPPAILIPSDFHPVSMNCVPCQPLFPGSKVWKAFGG